MQVGLQVSKHAEILRAGVADSQQKMNKKDSELAEAEMRLLAVVPKADSYASSCDVMVRLRTHQLTHPPSRHGPHSLHTL